jgi:endonuclease-8
VEGPSIHLAVEQLRPFAGRRIREVEGNSRAGIERLRRLTIRDIFAWGKHLVFQTDRLALRVHFLLWGTFAATVRGESVTGDYRRGGAPRLMLTFVNGEITMWSCSIAIFETGDARARYDFAVDVLSPNWDAARAFSATRRHPDAQIADVLLDQSIFAGVGNIIKNEVLFRARTHPLTVVRSLSDRRLRAIVADARVFSFLFLEWRRAFALRKHLELYGRSRCPSCGGPVRRQVHGVRARRSFFCARCQPLRARVSGRVGDVAARSARHRVTRRRRAR